jgi:myo-inositol-1-phosphate synthase
LTERAYRNGDRGLLTFLASFFKSPIGTTQNDFVRQFEMLEEWVAKVAAA